MAILVGTASWTDKTLVESGLFYPPEAKSAEARLRFYASRFPMVEVDSSYYAIPQPSTSQLWVERTPPGFVFNIKAFRLFTGHQTSPTVLHQDIREALPASANKMLYYRDLPPDILDELWRRYKEALEPLRAASKLTAVHFQFAPWIISNRDGHAHVRECADRMAGTQLAVEFRNLSWFDEAHQAATLEFERKLGVAHVVVDGPQGFSNCVPSIWAVSSPKLAVVRLHGRNAATWNIKGATVASDRFNYDYPEHELEQLIPSIRELERRAELVQVIFNNNYQDQGQRNAATLMRLLGDAPRVSPAVSRGDLLGD
ncbi:DUF72 domain-containing protein [Polaromonas jejuensis]|uniref:DUF72 domain-containing protein n=1 Tax=Polaromonas jejuensis TaxID=457502 RepID=A0ABW0Q6H5_9BURK|nr:DUF72 domain-containing protein [Polaromonas jejuensis]